LAIPYLNNVIDHVYVSSYDKIFTHPDPTNCPVTSCTLRSSDCSAALASNSYFSLTNGNTPYATSAKQNIVDGWTDIDFCYKCSGTKFTSGTYEFTSAGLKVRQIRDCATYIADAVGKPSATTKLAYSASTTFTDYTLANIFLIKDESDCGTTSCALYKGDVGSCD
jgi:hypothetical protein